MGALNIDSMDSMETGQRIPKGKARDTKGNFC